MACISPYFRQLKGDWVPLPCGRCPPCKRRRIDSWVFRMLQEDKVSSSAHFITLTYSPSHLPVSPNGYPTLDKKAFPLFMKRLRKLLPDGSPKVKYYACGEYGEQRSRPHYHAIVFNVQDDSLYAKAWSLGGVQFGTVHVGTVTDKSIAYCAAYINTPGLPPSARRFDDRVPEFSLMSKGLGSSYVTPAIVDYHNADLSRVYLTKLGGDKIAMPRYYRERIFDEDARAAQGSLAEIASGVRNSEKYAKFLRLYGKVDDYSFDKFLEAERLGAVSQYYSPSKKARK